MFRVPSIIRASALPILVAATVLAACGGGAGDRSVERAQTVSPDASTTDTTASAESPAVPAGDPASADQSQPDEPRFVCPEGGLDEVIALQASVDQGHQPWRLSAPDVAAACTLGISGTSVEPAGVNRYHVTHAASGESVIVDLAQPLGPDGIWVVTSVTTSPPATTAGAASCTASAMLPATRQALEAGGGIQITEVIVRECQNGYARVTAVPDNRTCGEPGGSCFENEQVFLTSTGDAWSHLTSGTGISCATDDDLFPALLAACEGLGLR
ncbi:MAG TPA: hypothetical protein VFH02_00505 [Jiangellaceae bacterium]|jgi:hypothetical protein|nr:hypothetical protein [Jiangellaceae bacterium]